MGKYILVYELSYSGDREIYTKEFGMEEEKLHEGVNKLAKEHKEHFDIIYAGFLQTEYKYEPVNIITKYKPVELDD